MKKISADLRTVPTALLFAAALATAAHANAEFDRWADAFSADWMRLSPQSATRTQYFTGVEQDAVDRQLTLTSQWGEVIGASASAQRAALARRGLEELKGFPRDTLMPAQRTSAALLQWSLDDAVNAHAFAQQRYVFDQFNGLQLDLINFLTQGHPIRNRRDVENYLARLALVALRLDEGIAETRNAMKAGFLPPRFIVQRVLEQLDGFLATKPAENVFVATLDTRIGNLGGAITAADRAKFVTAAREIVESAVLPAYGRVRALLNEQLPATTDDAGVWRWQRGGEFYRQELAHFTTTTMTVDEIHALGLREVARIQGEMDRILRELGYTEGSIKERYEKLETAMQPPASPDPRPKLLTDAAAFVHDAEKRATTMFDLRPRARIVVRREPPFSEATAAAHYTDPAPDGSQPGVFWYPLPGPRYKMVEMRSLAYHEAVPGHHFQLAIQQESADLPRFRKLGAYGFISAYGEGWALYAERLADENGWYEGDPRGRLGYLESMNYRAKRLVVDTGLHAKKWTRDQVIDYGFRRQEAERYTVWPGQACSYMIGQLRIVELREKARAALGAKFSIKDFHNVVLRVGNVPLDVLAQEIDGWMASKK